MILAHDLGTTGNKASLYSNEGQLVASVTCGYPVDMASGGKAEQDPQHWWQAVIDATRQLLELAGRPQVDAVGFSGQMMGVVSLDAQLQPVRPAIIWADTRSEAQCQQLLTRVPMEQAYRITGHRLNPTYSLSKIMWLRDHEPQAFARIRHVVLAKDYAVYQLTGVLATDPSDASSTNAFDQQQHCWSPLLLDAAGIDPALLPEILPSTRVVGGITPQAAQLTGLRAGTPVVMGGGDGPCAAVGAGVVAPDSGAYVYLGSSSWVSVSAPQPLADPRMRSMTFNHVVPGQYVPTATMQTGGASLEWYADLIDPDRSPGRMERLTAPIDQAAGCEDGLYFLPHLFGERSPYWNPQARGAFIGIQKHHTQADLGRAVLQGVAFNLLTGLRAFEESGLPSPSHLDAIGGGAKSDAWLQILADVWNLPVRRRSLVDEANSLGAALTAAVGVGLQPDFSGAAQMSQVTHVFWPNPDQHRLYQEKYPLFLRLYERLEPLFPLL